MNVNSLKVNLIVTALVAVLVLVLPWIDHRLCRRLRLKPQGGLSGHPRADHLLRLRQRLLVLLFLAYVLLFAWLVFFSRTSSSGYSVHVAPLEDLKNAFSTPTGFTGWFKTLFTEGVSTAFSQISIVRPADLAQFYLNMMLFVPMGYLLPYVFPWFRARVRIRPVLFCLLISLLVENLQLITRRGLYDFDDIISNTLGGLLGQLLYIAFGYVVTHPHWRRSLRTYRHWRRHAHNRPLYRGTRESSFFRTTLWGTDAAVIRDFYESRLGFRLRHAETLEETGETLFLFDLNGNQVRIRCGSRAKLPSYQVLTLGVTHLPAVRRRLVDGGFQPGSYESDPCSGLRMLSFPGPDNVWIELIESP